MTKLVGPHGGQLVNRLNSAAADLAPPTSIEISRDTLMDLEQIAIGTFSPLTGFMDSKDFYGMRDDMRLSDGTVWTLPITLRVDALDRAIIDDNDSVSLTFGGEKYGQIDISEIYEVDLETSAEKIFGTKSLEHPGVKRFLNDGQYFVGGDITLFKRMESPHKDIELTPYEARAEFDRRGWETVIGFHTRNVIHRSHEFIQLDGKEKTRSDGLFVHPVIGKKKSGDFETNFIVKAYQEMIDNHYPEGSTVFGGFSTFSRYCGPREAVFTALCRKNFGCSSFIVGRDHTGVGNFYEPYAAHEIFDQFKGDLGIEPVRYGIVFHSKDQQKYLHEKEHPYHPVHDKEHISGTQAREMLLRGEAPPGWFMRPEVSKIILDGVRGGERVFVE